MGRKQKQFTWLKTLPLLIMVSIASILMMTCLPIVNPPDESAEKAPCIGKTVDWMNFIHLDDITYSGPDYRDEFEVEPDMLGEEVAQIKFMVNCNANGDHKAQNGDAAFLPIGTPIYALKGYATSFRLVAMQNGQLTLFEAFTNPHAQRGADLLDIADKVERITISKGQGFRARYP